MEYICRTDLHGNKREKQREGHRCLRTSYSSIPIEQESGPRAAQSKTMREDRKPGEGSRGINGTQVREAQLPRARNRAFFRNTHVNVASVETGDGERMSSVV